MRKATLRVIIAIAICNLTVVLLAGGWELGRSGSVPVWGWLLGLVVVMELVGLIWYLLNLFSQVRAISGRAAIIAQGRERGPVIDLPWNLFAELNGALNQIQTQQRHQQKTVTNVTEELVGVLNHLPVGVMVINDQQKVVLANQSMAAMLATTISEETHRFTDDISSAALLTMINSAITHRENGHQEITNFQRASTWDAQVVSLDGEVSAVLVILYDITTLVAAKQSQIDFLRNASHELKTPVATIKGFAETLQAGAKDDPETLNDFLGEIDTASQQLTDLVNDILVISHVQMQETGTVETIPLAQLVQSELVKWQPAANRQRLTLSEDIDPQLMITGNRQAIVRIVGNLVSNAVKYNQDGGFVKVTADQTTNSWHLTVSDSGIGIPVSDQSRIFERFYRVDQSHSNQTVEGTGLGLAIVAELAAAYHAQIDLNTQPGQGTSITLTFPLSATE